MERFAEEACLQARGGVRYWRPNHPYGRRHSKHMTDKRLYISTAPTREEANTLASEMVGRRLAACVNILGPVASVYRWQGEVENSEEFLLLIKSTEECGAAIQQVLTELHSYKVPELICLPIEGGLESYLSWIAASVKKG